MRIVFANKYYYLKGGAESYLFSLKSLLESRGHDVVPFAMAEEKNAATPWAKYFVSAVDTDARTLSLQGLRTAGRFVYSFEARRKFSALLDEAKPDIVHVHNIYHQISPSILPEARRRKLPVVMTAHDYNLIAPNYGLFHDGAICERTKPHQYWEAVRHRCVRGSLAASALAAFEKTVQRSLRLYEPNIDVIIAPSAFVAEKYAEFGVDAAKIIRIPHFVDAAAVTPSYEGRYALCVTRLSEEKGVDVLLRAAAFAHDIPVRIVGAGPQEKYLKRLAEELKLDNVEFVGFRSGDALRAEYAGSRFVVVPSLTYETFGLTALEAYAAGKPVAAARIGGLLEVVRDGETGFLWTAGDAHALADAMHKLWDVQTAATLGREGRRWAETEFSPDVHYGRIMDAYAAAAKKTKG